MTTFALFETFSRLRVLVIGDAMIDRYIYGAVTRISPEAPVPIVLRQRTDEHPGGAANVALNLRSLGAQVNLVSVFGDDGIDELRYLLSLKEIGHQSIISDDKRPATIKTRIMAGRQQLLRIDSESTTDISPSQEALLILAVEQHLKKGCDAIILQDYNKGVLTENVITEVMAMAQKYGCMTTVDPKFNHFFDYKGATLFKPNLKETRDALKIDISPDQVSLTEVSSQLRQKINCQHVMITLSERGIFYDDGQSIGILPTLTREIADVSGAGDTVISVATLALAVGLPMQQVTHIANVAASLVCKLPGVVAVDKQALIKLL